MSIEVRSNLTETQFVDGFVKNKRPVIIKDIVNKWEASEKWTLDYFKNIGSDTKIRIKKGNVAEGKTESITLCEYASQVQQYEDDLKSGVKHEKPAYLHDFPIFSVMPRLVDDITSFPTQYFPRWYRGRWWNFVQFFMGPTGSLTPLHFDTLYTHNLFFQIKGSKKFTRVAEADQHNCYLTNWRWSKVNPRVPDYEKFPLFKGVAIEEVIVNAGDILYIPPGTLHYVTGENQSISFNIDWHTRKPVIKGMSSSLRGAPVKNFQYNFIAFLGVWLGIPENYIFSYYKSYLNYIS